MTPFKQNSDNASSDQMKSLKTSTIKDAAGGSVIGSQVTKSTKASTAKRSNYEDPTEEMNTRWLRII